jgi:hypothetical protein
MPDLVFFQEVVPQSYYLIKENFEIFNFYNMVTGVGEETITKSNPSIYFTMILYNNQTMKALEDKKIIKFENSKMNRNILNLKLKYLNKIDISAMCVHLESLKAYSKERMEQLSICFNEILKEKDKYHVLFGGDLNIREAEVLFV